MIRVVIPRTIPSSVGPISSSINLTVDEFDNEWNDEKREFLDLSQALSDLSQALSDQTVDDYDNEWNDKHHDWYKKWVFELF